METIEKDVRVTELSIGDVILPTMGVVTHRPYDSVKCPKGKIHLGVNGFLKTWGKSTTIRVRRTI